MKKYFALLIPALVFVTGLDLDGQEARPAPAPGNPAYDPLPSAEPVAEKKDKAKRKGKTRTTPVIYYTLLSKASGNCVAISMAEKKDGGVAIEWTSALSHEQQWQLKQIEGEWFQLVARHSDRALTIRGTKLDPVIQGNTDNGESSHWNLVSDSDGFVRVVNRSSGQCMAVARNEGAHGAGVVLSEKADTDRQKWILQVAEIDCTKEILSKSLAVPASVLIGKKHPTNTEELKEFLHGTTWSIRYGSMQGSEEYRMTFDKKGTLTLNHGRVSTLHFMGPKMLKLWSYDYAALSDQFNYFQAVDANGKVYYGVLLPNEE